jgi:hypothetical protein
MHDSEAGLRAGNITILPSYPEMFHLPNAEIRAVLAPGGMWFVNRELDLDPTHALNSDFPDIAPVRVKEFLDSSWARGAPAAPSEVRM